VIGDKTDVYSEIVLVRVVYRGRSELLRLVVYVFAC